MSTNDNIIFINRFKNGCKFRIFMGKIVLQNCAGLLSKLVGELEFEHNAMWYGDDIFTTRTVS